MSAATPTPSAEFLLVITNVPDSACAAAIASALVERRLAACVNVLGACQSVYRWQGKVERADEIPLLIKTSAARYEELAAALVELHPYDVPELIAIPVIAGLPAYLDWVAAQIVAPDAGVDG